MLKRAIAAGVLVIFGLSGRSPRPKSVVAQTKPVVSATEDAHLRRECAKQADRVEKDKPNSDSDEMISWSSNYSIADNRCYVFESSYNRRLDLKLSFLYDGHTEENLASTEQGNGQINGTIEGTPDVDCSPVSDCGYASAQKYINERVQQYVQ